MSKATDSSNGTQAVISIDLNDKASLAAALASGITTPELLAAVLDEHGIECELIDDCLVVEPNTWHVSDDSGCDVAYEDTDADDAMQEYIDGGDWGSDTKTSFINLSAWRTGLDEDGDETNVDKQSKTYELEPDERRQYRL